LSNDVDRVAVKRPESAVVRREHGDDEKGRELRPEVDGAVGAPFPSEV